LTDVVLDASVVLEWFRGAGASSARSRTEFTAGRLVVVAPSLLFLEVVNAAGRRWGWGGEDLVRLAGSLLALGFEVAEPPLDAVAEWTGRGLTAYDAAYAALAESLRVALLTLDTEVLRVAPQVAAKPS
jgi:predicted nucleic acid-binding protein